MLSDTIAAISTPIGEGAISIVRISGPQALAITKKIFPTFKRRRAESHHVYYGWICHPQTQEKLDEVLLTYLKKPKTYTREDIIEINCHGGITVSKRVLDLVVRLGARLAEPGEFTKRAFVNGRLGLTQAEAVIDLIRAKTEQSSAHSIYQLRGGLKQEIDEISATVQGLLVQVELLIDFTDEDLDVSDYQGLCDGISVLLKKIKSLLETASEGKIFRQGVNVVIAGRPNVGKSSLLNALLKEKRAIVTPISGTTRDIIEEYVNIEGVPFIICDTAGITETSNKVEKEGIRRAQKAIKLADLVIVVHDITDRQDQPFRVEQAPQKKIIEVYNKVDKLRDATDTKKRNSDAVLTISVKTGLGLERLRKMMVERVLKKEFRQADHPFISNSRQRDALQRASRVLVAARRSIRAEASPDLIALDLRIALDCLGEISGKVTKEDILNDIFGQFCIGK